LKRQGNQVAVETLPWFFSLFICQRPLPFRARGRRLYRDPNPLSRSFFHRGHPAPLPKGRTPYRGPSLAVKDFFAPDPKTPSPFKEPRPQDLLALGKKTLREKPKQRSRKNCGGIEKFSFSLKIQRVFAIPRMFFLSLEEPSRRSCFSRARIRDPRATTAPASMHIDFFRRPVTRRKMGGIRHRNHPGHPLRA